MQMPLCFVCFIWPDPSHVHIKASSLELASPLYSLRSFIEDVIGHPEPRLREALDAHATGTYSMDELVLSPPQMRYFAGAQIAHDGVGIGALIVADRTVRGPLSVEDAKYLEDCAHCITEFLATHPPDR